MGHLESPRKLRGIVSVRAEATPDNPAAMLDKIAARMDEFQKEHTEALAKKADVVTEEKVDSINASITDLQEALEKVTAQQKEAQAQLDAVEAAERRIKNNGTDPEVDYRAEAEKFMAGARGVTSYPVSDAEVEAYQSYADKTFAMFVRAGDTGHDIKASMQVGSDPDGGYWVPTQMQNDIKKRLFETSPMRSVASAITITTDSVKFPTDTNDAVSGGWVGETETRTETDTPQMGEQEVFVREQYAEPRITQRLLDMATIDAAGWLSGKISDKMVRTENTAFVSGAGVKQPRGFLDYKADAVTTDDVSRPWGALQYVPSGSSGGFPDISGVSGAKDPDALITLISKMNPAYLPGAVFAMNRATQATIRKLKDADGRYLVGFGNIQDGTQFDLFGYPITNMEDMPNIGSDSYSLAFGNFGVGYQIVDGRGFRVLRDNLTLKGWVKFYTTKFTGGDVVNFDAIKLMKFATS